MEWVYFDNVKADCPWKVPNKFDSAGSAPFYGARFSDDTLVGTFSIYEDVGSFVYESEKKFVFFSVSPIFTMGIENKKPKELIGTAYNCHKTILHVDRIVSNSPLTERFIAKFEEIAHDCDLFNKLITFVLGEPPDKLLTSIAISNIAVEKLKSFGREI